MANIIVKYIYDDDSVSNWEDSFNISCGQYFSITLGLSHVKKVIVEFSGYDDCFNHRCCSFHVLTAGNFSEVDFKHYIIKPHSFKFIYDVTLENLTSRLVFNDLECDCICPNLEDIEDILTEYL